jgi:hypothetical protein
MDQSRADNPAVAAVALLLTSSLPFVPFLSFTDKKNSGKVEANRITPVLLPRKQILG